ncbi:MAG: ribosome silencing factor [Bacteroidales bacterium]|nr:ribosome silencing factor [Bacteroidales bacterium]
MNISTDQKVINTIVEAIQDRKGKDTVVIDLTRLDVSNAQYFIVTQGNTPTQVAAIADSVRETLLEQTGIKPVNYTGYSNATWIVLDYGFIMVHIFVPETRNFYDIEQLWADGDFTRIPDLD